MPGRSRPLDRRRVHGEQVCAAVSISSLDHLGVGVRAAVKGEAVGVSKRQPANVYRRRIRAGRGRRRARSSCRAGGCRRTRAGGKECETSRRHCDIDRCADCAVHADERIHPRSRSGRGSLTVAAAVVERRQRIRPPSTSDGRSCRPAENSEPRILGREYPRICDCWTVPTPPTVAGVGHGSEPRWLTHHTGSTRAASSVSRTRTVVMVAPRVNRGQSCARSARSGGSAAGTSVTPSVLNCRWGPDGRPVMRTQSWAAESAGHEPA